MRVFATGATRDTDNGKNDYEGYLSPIFLEEFGDYMTKHRRQADGNLRDSDNWQKGIPSEQYMKSLIRHAKDLWMLHRGYVSKRMRSEMPDSPRVEMIREAIGGLMFNLQGYVHEMFKAEYVLLNSKPSPEGAHE
jgi:hypothetical protein